MMFIMTFSLLLCFSTAFMLNFFFFPVKNFKFYGRLYLAEVTSDLGKYQIKFA